MTKDDNWASPGKPVKRFFKAALVELFIQGGPHRRTLGTYKWVQGYSEHPDGRFPHYPARVLRQLPSVTARLVRKPTKEDWYAP
jgi:hypothetical protein